MSTTAEAKEKPGAETSTWESLKTALTESILSSIVSVIESRTNYYANPKNKKPEVADIPGIISSYSLKNAVVSGGATILPGPWGMAGSIPEIGILMRNQIAMIFDIGVAYGKEDSMTKELVAGIMMSSAGSIGGKLLIVQGERLIVKRVSLRMFQKAIELFGSRVLQQMLKSVISKWLPFVGALAMATWSNYSTKLIGRLAADLLKKRIEEVDQSNSDVSEEDILETETPETPPPVNNVFDKNRIRALIALMQVDHLRKQEERDFIISQIADTNLSEDECLDLIALANSEEQIVLDPTEYSLDHDTAISYLTDMATLAGIDNELHPDEIETINGFGISQGVPPEEIQSIIEATTFNLEPEREACDQPKGSPSNEPQKRKRRAREIAPETPEQIQERETIIRELIAQALIDDRKTKRNLHGLQISAFRPTFLSIVNRNNLSLIGGLRAKYQLNATTSENRIACFLFDTVTDYVIQEDGTSGTAKNYIRHLDNDFLWRRR